MRCRAIFLVPLVCLLVIQDSEGQRSVTDWYRGIQRVGPGKLPKPTTSFDLSRRQLARATTSFGLSLYRQLAGQDQTGNVVFSPFSVYTALAMTMLGAQGPTKDQLQAVLTQRPRQGNHSDRPSSFTAQVNLYMESLLAQVLLEGIHGALHAVLASFPSSGNVNVTLKVANALYYNDSLVTMADNFVRNLRSRYGARPTPFEQQEPEAPINEWVSRQTEGKIEGFLNRGDITPDMAMILLNAVFFKGKWRDEFDERKTFEGDFTTASGDVVRVPMMSTNGEYSVKYPSENFPAHVLELPYGTDDRYSMFILMPERPDGMRDLEGRLNSQFQSLEEAVTGMPPASTRTVSMPKFKLRSKTSLKQVLEAMGLTRFFRNASFQRMVRYSSGSLVAGDVKHEAVVEVDEKGTTTAAVTSLELLGKSRPPSFTVDRPFVFILRDKKARINLFMGRLNNPAME